MPQPENAWKWKCRFSSLGTSRGPKLFPKAFLHKVMYNYYSKKFFEHFVLKNGASKNGFPIVCHLAEAGSLFWQNNSEKAKLPKICISFCGSMPIAQIKSGHLTPSPTIGLYFSFFLLSHSISHFLSHYFILPQYLSQPLFSLTSHIPLPYLSSMLSQISILISS